MNACGTLPAKSIPSIAPTPKPTVFVDGSPDPRWIVRDYQSQGLADRRRVTLETPDRLTNPDQWSSRSVAVGIARRLSDEQIRWQMLVQGRLAQVQTLRQRQTDQKQFELIDAWSEKLDGRAPTIWWSDPDVGLIAQTSGTLRAGSPGNRSTQTHMIAGRQTHVLQDQGHTWTLAQALEFLSASHAIALDQTLIPPDRLIAPLPSNINLANTLERLLTDLLAPYALVVQQRLAPIGSLAPSRWIIRPLDHGRRVDLRSTNTLRQDDQRSLGLAQQWVVRGAPRQIESTFTLTPGWDAALQGQPDSDYDRAASSGFATYANVYRRWVLNEDAQFAGDVFDLTTFFNDGFVRPLPLPFESCLTQDESGVRRPVIVEVSTDDGVNWSSYPGQPIVQRDRASIYLDDATLPATFFAAAKAGSAKVRVTATLTSPMPVQLARWQGNPFAGIAAPRTFDLADTFAFRHVNSQSIHRSAIDLGALTADEFDASAAMHDWLVHRLANHTNTTHARQRVTQPGTLPELRVGDRWASAHLNQVNVSFADGTTTLELQY